MKKIFEILMENKKYLAIGLIFFLAFSLGKNIFDDEMDPALAPPFQEKLTSANLEGYNFNYLGKNDFQRILADNLNAEQGKYRLLLDVMVSPDRNTLFFSKNEGPEAIKNRMYNLNLCFLTSLGEKTCFEKLSLKQGINFETVEVIFDSLTDFQRLTAEKNTNTDLSVYKIRNFRLSKISGASNESIIGRSLDNISSSYTDGDNSLISFEEKNARAGQIFIANTDNLAYLEIKPKLAGSGGGGVITLELRNASQDVHGYQVGDIITTSDINVQEITGRLTVDNTLVVPIAAKLQKGSSYYLGFNNDAAIFNNLDFVQFVGCEKMDYDQGIAVRIGADNKISPIGNLFFKTHSLALTHISDKTIMTGAAIEKSDARGQYTYKMKKDVADLIDLDEIVISDTTIERVNYDTLRQALTGTGLSSFTYQFDTIYPIETFSLSAKKIDDENCFTKVEYSLDRETWLELPEISLQGFSSVFRLNIRADSMLGNKVYLKVSRGNTERTEGIFFGLDDLNVTANLRMQ